MSIFTNFLNLFKWQPDIDGEEEFDIDTALNDNWDKIDAGVKKINQDIKNIEKSCVAISPTQPTTNESVWIKKGKNELNTVDLQVQTINGVTITRNSDGTIKLDGTATASGGVVLLSGINKKLSGKYTFSLKVISGSMTGNSTRFSINNSSSSSATNTTARLFSNVLNAGGTSASNTAEISDTMYYLTAYINSGCVFNNCVIALQVEAGETATPYEQFIEEKILIKNNAGQFEEYSDVVVSSVKPAQGKVWIKKGKNLLNKNALQQIFIPVGSTTENLEYTVGSWTTEWIHCKPNTAYTVSGHNRGRWQLKSSSGAITFIDARTITTNADTEYFRCYVWNDDGGALDTAKIQIEQGSTATTYEAYIEKEIYVKNSNGVFERFYKEDAEKQKVVLFNNPSNTANTVQLSDSAYNYSYLYVESSNQLHYVILPIIKDNQTYLNGIGGWSGEANVGSTHFTGSLSNNGKTLTANYFKTMVHTESSSHSVGTNRTIVSVIGVR